MPFEPDFIRTEIDSQSYQISLHVDDERLADGLTIAELERRFWIVKSSSRIQKMRAVRVA